MARKISGGLVGQPSVGAINVAPTAVVTAAQDQNITISPIGTAAVVMTNNVQLDAQNDLRFADADSSNWVGFQAPATISSNVTWTLPAVDGTAPGAGISNQVLSTNGVGTLSWISPNVSLVDQTISSSTHFITLTDSTSDTTISTLNRSSTKLSFQPSTATLISEGPVVHRRPENVQAGTYTLALTDRNIVVTMNNSGAATVTIPTDLVVDFPIGSEVWITRIGSGSVTLAAPGVTVNAGGTGNMALGETVQLRKRGANNWFVNQRPYSVSGSGGSTSTIGDISVHQYTSGTSTFVVGT
jgi:hypothetical protein